MKFLKKVFSLLIILNTSLISIWALPGFESYLPDISGEYVYYEDTTFLRKSYIGFLFYNDSTIHARYYAPADTEKKLPENEVSILISIDPNSSYFKMTGDRILSAITQDSDDITIVNYIYNILYDFSKARNKVSNLNDRNIELYQDISQFGGKVVINYDCTIPLFNIKNIEDDNGEYLFKCVTVGKITDNTDHSFEDFKGIPDNKIKKNIRKYKKAKPEKITFNNQSITLDSNWIQEMENFWGLKNSDSLISLYTTSIPPLKDKSTIENFLIRNFTRGGQNTYIIYDTLEIKKDNERLTIQAETYNTTTKKFVVNYILLSSNENTDYIDIFSLNTDKKAWITNEIYFKNIIESYEN